MNAGANRSYFCRRSYGKIICNYPKGWCGFLGAAPNRTLCSDGEIVRLGFMSPNDVGAFVGHLESFGFVYEKSGGAEDLAVVDQNIGPMVPSGWLELSRVTIKASGDRHILVARLQNSVLEEIAFPEGWTFAGSLSETSTFVPNAAFKKALRLRKSDVGVDVYENIHTGEVVYMGRTSRDTEK